MEAYRGIRILTTEGKTACFVPFDSAVYQFPDIQTAQEFIGYCLKRGAIADGALTV